MNDGRTRLRADLVRAVCGGSMFALPLLYTMEMWWLGYTLSTGRCILWLLATFFLCALLNWLAGYREAESVTADFGDAGVSVAIGLSLSATLLAVLGEIGPGSGPLPVLRQIIVLAIPVSIGVSISRSLLPTDSRDQEAVFEHRPVGARIAVAIAGALLLGLSAAPTEEIRQIATRVTWVHLLAMAALSVSWTSGAIFVARFPGPASREARLHAWGETALVYAVGLVTSGALLATLGFLEWSDGAGHLLATVVTLGLPATLGAALGRLLL